MTGKQLLTCLLCSQLFMVHHHPEITMFATQLLIFCYPVFHRVHLCKSGMYCIFCVYGRQYRSKSTARNTDTTSDRDRQSRFKRINVNYEYFDGGNHFCRCCNCFSVNIFEHCQHLISSAHQQVDYISQSINLIF